MNPVVIIVALVFMAVMGLVGLAPFILSGRISEEERRRAHR